MESADRDGNTTLHQAVLSGAVRGAEALVAQGANVNAKSRTGQTPLSQAKTRKDDTLMGLLSRKPSRPQGADDQATPPLNDWKSHHGAHAAPPKSRATGHFPLK
ncbi:MAG: ankyrin repeat domain-containing protein [Myxococcales bacterium]|nr:ankyrin repeat domain-containing protein [Myxococcales bacterium]